MLFGGHIFSYVNFSLGNLPGSKNTGGVCSDLSKDKKCIAEKSYGI